MTDNKFIAASVQASPVFLDKDKTIKKVCKLIKEAKKNGAELIVFPEAFIPTYPFWPKDLGFGPERKLVMDAQMQLYENSVEIPGKDIQKIAKVAKKENIHVVIGGNEKDGGTLYNTIVYLANDGSIIGKHRKLMSIDSEKCVWGNGNADDVNVFDTKLGKIGGLFCYEHHLKFGERSWAEMR